MKILALTITDKNFFAGTITAVNSLLYYTQNWPKDWTLDIAVVTNGEYSTPLAHGQAEVFINAGYNRVTLYSHKKFEKPGRTFGAWQLKTYAAADLAAGYDLLLGFDSDLIFCSDVRDVIELSLKDGKFRGGEDGNFGAIPGATYTEEYAVYGIKPGTTAPYMSASCYFCPLNDINLQILQDWAVKTDTAMYNTQPTKIYPGHGDQGVLNAIIAATTGCKNVELLPNKLWSQHGPNFADRFIWNGESIINVDAGGAPVRTLHSCNTVKFWTTKYSPAGSKAAAVRRWCYAQFLRFLHFGPLANQPGLSTPLSARFSNQHHLFFDAIQNYELLCALDPTIKTKWRQLPAEWFGVAFTAVAALDVKRLDTWLSLLNNLQEDARVAVIGDSSPLAGTALAAALLPKRTQIILLPNTQQPKAAQINAEHLRLIKKCYPALALQITEVAADSFADSAPDAFADAVIVADAKNCANLQPLLKKWLRKTKTNGIIIGNDYSNAATNAAVRAVISQPQNDGVMWWTEKHA